MIDLSFIKPETIPTLVISALALVVAVFSAGFTYKNYKINEGPEWRLNKIGDSLWQVERNHRKRVAFIGLTTTPSYLGIKPSLVGPKEGLLLTKGDTIKFEIDSRKVKDLQHVKLVVYSKPCIFKTLNRNSYNEELTKKLFHHFEPKNAYSEWHSRMAQRNNPPTLSKKIATIAKKIVFKQKIKVLGIGVWRSDIL